ncbi:MAG: aldo/keto reductase [Firmicutes bacterium]|nr:aldo/keto reductase [Bacillota bacterium]
MKYSSLGNTGIKVSILGFGTLTMGPFQENLSYSEGAELIRIALLRGINLLDTAEAYKTYPYIKDALSGGFPRYLERIGKPAPVIISRSYAFTEKDMEESLKKALEEMELETIDMFLLHQQESELTLLGHKPALKYLCRAKEEGLVKAVGISTHHIAAVKAASLMKEIDVIFAIINKDGIGIQDGATDDMFSALQTASGLGKGILIMKALGGGHLYRNAEESLKFAFSLPFAHSVMVGMKNLDELEMNINIAESKKVDEEIKDRLSSRKKRLNIEACRTCETCVRECKYGALSNADGKIVVDMEKCILCSYCAMKCPDFCISVL